MGEEKRGAESLCVVVVVVVVVMMGVVGGGLWDVGRVGLRIEDGVEGMEIGDDGDSGRGEVCIGPGIDGVFEGKGGRRKGKTGCSQVKWRSR